MAAKRRRSTTTSKDNKALYQSLIRITPKVRNLLVLESLKQIAEDSYYLYNKQDEVKLTFDDLVVTVVDKVGVNTGLKLMKMVSDDLRGKKRKDFKEVLKAFNRMIFCLEKEINVHQTGK